MSNFLFLQEAWETQSENSATFIITLKYLLKAATTIKHSISLNG